MNLNNHNGPETLNQVATHVTLDSNMQEVFVEPAPLSAEELTITSAVQLTDEEIQQIVDLMVKKMTKPLGNVQVVVDESLLTGVSIQSDTFYFEISARKTLRELKAALKVIK